jgi:hypothetical protein
MTRRGFTLLEMVTALGCTSVLLAAIGSAFLLASKALPDGDHPIFQVTRASSVLEELAQELRTCRYLTQADATAIRMVCDDRSGDGLPEVIAYRWSGPGGALKRSVNGQDARTVLEDVTDFSLEYETTTGDLTFPGPAVEGALTTVSGFDQASGTDLHDVEDDERLGQYFYPSLPAGAVSWKLQYILYRARRTGSTGDTLLGFHYANADRTPGALIQQFTKPNWQISWSTGWEMDFFSGADNLPVDRGYCFTFSCPDGVTEAARVEYSTSRGGYQMESEDGTSWDVEDDSSVIFYIYGRAYLPSEDRTVSRTFYQRVRASIRTGPDALSTAETGVRLENLPEKLSHVWEAQFDADPTEQDFDADGADFVLRGGGGFNASGLSDGIWKAGATLDTAEKCNFDRVTICRVRFRAASTHTGGALFWINADASDADKKLAPIYARLALEADGTQSLTLHNKSSNSTTVTLKKITGLPGRMIDLRLVIDPEVDAVNLSVDGEDYGTYTYSRFVPSFDDRFASVLSGGATAMFDSVQILVQP